MLVKELIEELSKFDPEAEVVIIEHDYFGYEGVQDVYLSPRDKHENKVVIA